MQDAILDQRFFSPTKGLRDFPTVIEDIFEEVQHAAGRPLCISVGTDSEEFGETVKFVTIIHLWRVGRGARAYRTEMQETLSLAGRHGSARFRERIWREVLLTATLAQELRSALRERLGASFLEGIEVHADVGHDGGSSVMIREVIGMFKGYGFPDEVIKLKPEAYAASAVADRYI